MSEFAIIVYREQSKQGGWVYLYYKENIVWLLIDVPYHGIYVLGVFKHVKIFSSVEASLTYVLDINLYLCFYPVHVLPL